jgi:hypothetical protein
MRPWRYSVFTLTLLLVGLPGIAAAALGSVNLERTTVTGGGPAPAKVLLTQPPLWGRFLP